MPNGTRGLRYGLHYVEQNSCRHLVLDFILEYFDAFARHIRTNNKMDRFHYCHPADLPITDHTAGNYHSKFSIPNGIHTKDYLRNSLLVAMQIED